MAFNFFQYWVYDVIFLIIFCLWVGIFLFKKRKNLKKEGIMYLYRTKVGINLIDYFGKKYKKAIDVFSVLAIISGYILMAIMLYMLWLLVKMYISRPDLVRAVKIAPLMPLIPYVDTLFKVSFLPPFYFTYWIIAIAVIALFHEFAHGIVARRYGVKIKATGFGFLGPFLAAFVDPDEKQMQKKTNFQQMAVLSAGTFANIILALIFFLLLSFFFILSYAPSGVIIGGYIAEPVKISSISYIGGNPLNNATKAEISYILDNKNLTSDLTLNLTGNFDNYTKIVSENKTYYISKALLKEELNVTNEQLVLFSDLPAIRSKMNPGEIIIEINGIAVTDYNSLGKIMNNSKPGEKVLIKTKYQGEIKTYNITLGESLASKGKGVIGVSFMKADNSRLIVKIYNFFNFAKKDFTDYQPRYNKGLIIFIYNLIWWLALINLSVALMNMLPVGIFDGGRFFMLTIQSITKNKKAGEIAFKIATYIILLAFALLMIGWIYATYVKV